MLFLLSSGGVCLLKLQVCCRKGELQMLWSMVQWSLVMNLQGKLPLAILAPSLSLLRILLADAQIMITRQFSRENGPKPRFTCCRVITELGPGVQRLRVGDRVALEPGVPCWSNKACREGRYNLCPDIKFFATPPHHGSLMQVRLLHCDFQAHLLQTRS